MNTQISSGDILIEIWQSWWDDMERKCINIENMIRARAYAKYSEMNNNHQPQSQVTWPYVVFYGSG